MSLCPYCGAERPEHPASVYTFGMHDNHTFTHLTATSVDGLIAEWRAAVAAGDDMELCPAIVMVGRREIRRVGKMVFHDYHRREPRSEDDVEAFRQALLADPDIPRLLAAREAAR